MATVKDSNNGNGDTVKWSMLKNIWPFLVAFFIIVSAWAVLTLQVAQLRTDFVKLAATYDEHLDYHVEMKATRDEQYLEIQVTLTEIQKDIAYLRAEWESRETVSIK
jgi:peptidoglycan hydrolase CwlO-like protein